MEETDLDWNAVSEAWESYRDAVAVWLDVAPDPEVDPDLIDGLIHQVMKEGRTWNALLDEVLNATHHH